MTSMNIWFPQQNATPTFASRFFGFGTAIRYYYKVDDRIKERSTSPCRFHLLGETPCGKISFRNPVSLFYVFLGLG